MKMRIKSGRRAPRHSRGLVLEIVLVVLLVLLLASTALFRSINSSTAVAGNIAFKTDANNRGQLAFDEILSWIGNRQNFADYVIKGVDCSGCNFSSRMLQTDAKGIPAILATDPLAFDNEYTYTPPDSAQMDTDNMKVRYLIERMCTKTGPSDARHCTLDTSGSPKDKIQMRPTTDLPGRPVLRVSIRVDGPRNTVSFAQATITP